MKIRGENKHMKNSPTSIRNMDVDLVPRFYLPSIRADFYSTGLFVPGDANIPEHIQITFYREK